MKRRALILFAAALVFVFIFTMSPAISASGTGKNARPVTFSKDVAPIFYKHCIECHRTDDLAPMSLVSYREARPWAKAIKEKVARREMPPWHADPHFGPYANDKRITQAELDTIIAWVDGGAKEGNPKDLPPAPTTTDGWQIGKPDLILEMPEEYTIEAQGSDEYIDFVIPTNLKEYKWVKAVEIHPGNKKVVHHAVAFIKPQQMADGQMNNRPDTNSIFFKEGTLIRTKADAPIYDDGCAAPNRGIARGSGQEALGPLLGFYAPGKDRDVFPQGAAKGLPAGSSIIIQMHYSKTTGKVERDRTRIGLIFAKETPEKMLLSNGALNHYFKIPAGAPSHEVKACYEFRQDTVLFTLMPHMHKRGKDMKFDVVYPDGKQQTLLSVPHYNFNWQSMYRFKEPVIIPKGSRMVITAHFDNSAKNKHNPDATKEVRWGDPTYDEMMIGYIDYIVRMPDRSAVKVEQKVLDSYAGEYEILGRTITIMRSGDNLMVGARGFPHAPLFAESENKFFFKVVDAQISFVKNDRGEVVELILDQGGRTFKARRLNKNGPAGENK